MKKAKIFLYTVLASFGIGVIIFFSIPVNLPTINMAGSSSVFPLAVFLSNKYNKSDIVAQAGGSGLGIDVAVTGKKDIGMASKNPNSKFNANPNDPNYDPNNPDYKLEPGWVSKEMKTTTIAWDGMGIVYKPPSDDKNFKLNITQNNLGNIYLAFAGYDTIPFNSIGSTSNLPIKPFARDGGAKKSGTAEAFYKTSNLKWDSNLNTEQIELITKALDKGDYGSNVLKTAEANSQAWDYFKSQNSDGSMIYLSAGFIIKNETEIKNLGYEIATYQGIKLTQEKITIGYNWYRPLNLMIPLLDSKNHVKEFIEWILYDEIAKITISDNGFIVLNNAQIDSMKINSNLWVPDSKLGFSGAKNE